MRSYVSYEYPAQTTISLTEFTERTEESEKIHDLCERKIIAPLLSFPFFKDGMRTFNDIPFTMQKRGGAFLDAFPGRTWERGERMGIICLSHLPLHAKGLSAHGGVGKKPAQDTRPG